MKESIVMHKFKQQKNRLQEHKTFRKKNLCTQKNTIIINEFSSSRTKQGNKSWIKKIG